MNGYNIIAKNLSYNVFNIDKERRAVPLRQLSPSCNRSSVQLCQRVTAVGRLSVCLSVTRFVLC